MQNDIVRQPTPNQPEPQVSDVHVQPGTEAPSIPQPVTDASAPPEAPVEQVAVENVLETESQPTPIEKPAKIKKQKQTSGRPMGVIIGAIIVFLVLSGLAIFAQLNPGNSGTVKQPQQASVVNDVSAQPSVEDLDAAITDAESNTPVADQSQELSDATLGL